jgi:hypothetical protein
MSHDELESNFMSLAITALPREQAAKIASMVRYLDEIKALRDLVDLWSALPTEARPIP